MAGVSQDYIRPRMHITLNSDGLLTGTIGLFLDDHTMVSSVTMPYVAPFPGRFVKLSVSVGTIVATATYDLNVYKNAGLEFTIGLDDTDSASIFDIDLSVVPTDEISVTIVQTSAAALTFDDIIVELTT